MKFTVLDKGGVIYLVPQRGVRAFRGLAKSTSPLGLREKRDRL
jgi:hypothetical protein